MFGDARRRPARGRPDRSSTAASRSASGSSCTAGCSTATVGRCRDQLVEIWQANAAGRYSTSATSCPRRSTRTSPGSAARLTDDDGRYRFTTIKPGAYPWKNHHNAWRPAHIHFSLFGRAFTQRLVTQMYFPGDPLFGHDPIFNSVPDEAARPAADLPLRPATSTEPEWALGFRVRHRAARPRTPRRSRPRPRPATRTTQLSTDAGRADAGSGSTPSQTVGPFLSIGLTWDDGPVGRRRPGRRAPSGSAGRLLDGAGEPVPDGVVETWQADPTAGSTIRTIRAERCAAGSAATPGRRPTPTGVRDPHRQARRGRPTVDGRMQAPHLDVTVLARGLLDRVVTRCLLRRRGGGQRRRSRCCGRCPTTSRATLVRRGRADGYRLDIHLQGERRDTSSSKSEAPGRGDPR